MFLSNGSYLNTLGDSVPTYSGSTYYAPSAVELSGAWAAYGAIYRRQLWAGAIVRKLGMATARMPFDAKLAGKGNSQSPENGPLAELLARPNEELSGFKLWLWTSATYDIYGEAFWLKIRDQRGRVRELWPLHPSNITLRRDQEGELRYYYGSGTVSFPYADVVAFISFNPDSLHRGLSNMESLRMTLLNEDASRRATASWWKRGARPSVVLKHPKALSEPAYNRLLHDFDAKHAGADNMGGTNILEEGLELQVIQLNAEEMQYIESRKLNREEVCAAYDVPPPVVHILDKATFSNITEQLRSMYRDTMAPRFELFESVIDHQLVPDFYGFGAAFTKFNMDEVLRGDFETRATAVGTLIEKGVLKPSEARPMFNLPDAGPEADQLYGNAALVPLGSNVRAQQIALDGNLIPQALPAPPVKRLTVRSIMGRLSQVKTNKDQTRQKLAEEHQKELLAFFGKQRDAIRAALDAKSARAGMSWKAFIEPGIWDAPLTELLTTLGLATSQAAGAATAAEGGGAFDGSSVAEWVASDAVVSARNINKRTAEQVADAEAAWDNEDDPDGWLDDAFDGPIGARAESIGWGRVAMIAGFAALVAAQQLNAATKTWYTTSANPRPSHAAMNGETVGIDELFSNGMNAPGDPSADSDELAGCSCGIKFNFEGA